MIENNPKVSDSLGWENLSSVKMKTDIAQLFQVEGGGRNDSTFVPKLHALKEVGVNLFNLRCLSKSIITSNFI